METNRFLKIIYRNYASDKDILGRHYYVPCLICYKKKKKCSHKTKYSTPSSVIRIMYSKLKSIGAKFIDDGSQLVKILRIENGEE
jgi:hypothetical protein